MVRCAILVYDSIPDTVKGHGIANISGAALSADHPTKDMVKDILYV